MSDKSQSGVYYLPIAPMEAVEEEDGARRCLCTRMRRRCGPLSRASLRWECWGVFASQQEALEACGAMNVSEWRDLGYHFTIDPGCFTQQYTDIEPVLTAAGGDEQ